MEFEIGKTAQSPILSCSDLTKEDTLNSNGNFYVGLRREAAYVTKCIHKFGFNWQLVYANSNDYSLKQGRSYNEWKSAAKGFDSNVPLTSTLLEGMFPVNELSADQNQLLILNQGIWNADSYFKITFTNPLHLRMLLNGDFKSVGSSKCVELSGTDYYVVETERDTYMFKSLYVSEYGYGIHGCFVEERATAAKENFFIPDPYHAQLQPDILFGDIFSSLRTQRTLYIAGRTDGSFVNSIRLFTSAHPIRENSVLLRYYRPDGSLCPEFPLYNSCECVSISAIQDARLMDIQPAKDIFVPRYDLPSDITKVNRTACVLNPSVDLVTVIPDDMVDDIVEPYIRFDGRPLPKVNQTTYPHLSKMWNTVPGLNKLFPSSVRFLYLTSVDKSSEVFSYSYKYFYPSNDFSGPVTPVEVFYKRRCFFTSNFDGFFEFLDPSQTYYYNLTTTDTTIFYIDDKLVYQHVGRAGAKEVSIVLNDHIEIPFIGVHTLSLFSVHSQCGLSEKDYSRFGVRTNFPITTLDASLVPTQPLDIWSAYTTTGTVVDPTNHIIVLQRKQSVSYSLIPLHNFLNQIHFAISAGTQTHSGICIFSNIQSTGLMKHMDNITQYEASAADRSLFEATCGTYSEPFGLLFQDKKTFILVGNQLVVTEITDSFNPLAPIHTLRVMLSVLISSMVVYYDDLDNPTFRVMSGIGCISGSPISWRVVNGFSVPITLYYSVIMSFESLASDFNLGHNRPQIQVNAGETFKINIQTTRQTEIYAFNNHVTIKLVGIHQSNNTVTQILDIEHRSVNYIDALVSAMTTKADSYDLYVYFRDQPIFGVPCYACVHVKPLEPSKSMILIEGLQASTPAGVSFAFEVILRDVYGNVLAESVKNIVQLVPNDPTIIYRDSSYRDRYVFVVFSSKIQEHQFSIEVNGEEISSHLVSIYAGKPSLYTSTLELVTDSMHRVLGHPIDFMLTVRDSRENVVSHDEYLALISITSINPDTRAETNYYSYEYVCSYKKASDFRTLGVNEKDYDVTHCFIKTKTASLLRVRVSVCKRDSIPKEDTTSGDVHDFSVLIHIGVEIKVQTPVLDCSSLDIQWPDYVDLNLDTVLLIYAKDQAGYKLCDRSVVDSHIDVFNHYFPTTKVPSLMMTSGECPIVYTVVPSSFDIRYNLDRSTISFFNLTVVCDQSQYLEIMKAASEETPQEEEEEVIDATPGRRLGDDSALITHKMMIGVDVFSHVYPPNTQCSIQVASQAGVAYFVVSVVLKDMNGFVLSDPLIQVYLSAVGPRNHTSYVATFKRSGTMYQAAFAPEEAGEYFIQVLSARTSSFIWLLQRTHVFTGGIPSSVILSGPGLSLASEASLTTYSGYFTLGLLDMYGNNLSWPGTSPLVLSCLSPEGEPIQVTHTVTPLTATTVRVNYTLTVDPEDYLDDVRLGIRVSTLYAQTYHVTLNSEPVTNVVIAPSANNIQNQFAAMSLEHFACSVHSDPLELSFEGPVVDQVDYIHVFGIDNTLGDADFCIRLAKSHNSFEIEPRIKKVGTYSVSISVLNQVVGSVVISVVANPLIQNVGIWGPGVIGGLVGEEYTIYANVKDAYGNDLDINNLSFVHSEPDRLEVEFTRYSNYAVIVFKLLALGSSMAKDSVAFGFMYDGVSVPSFLKKSLGDKLNFVNNLLDWGTSTYTQLDESLIAGDIAYFRLIPRDRFGHSIPVSREYTTLKIKIYNEATGSLFLCDNLVEEECKSADSVVQNIVQLAPTSSMLSTDEELVLMFGITRVGKYRIDICHYNAPTNCISHKFSISHGSFSKDRSYMMIDEVSHDMFIIVPDHLVEKVIHGWIFITHDSLAKTMTTIVLTMREIVFRLKISDEYGNQFLSSGSVQVVVTEGPYRREYTELSVVDDVKGYCNVFLVFERPGFYHLTFLSDTIQIGPVFPLVVMSERLDNVAFFNDRTICDVDDLAEEEENLLCGLRGTHIGVKTGFICEVTLSFISFMNWHSIPLNEIPVEVTFTNLEDSRFKFTIPYANSSMVYDSIWVRDYFYSYDTMSEISPEKLGSYSISISYRGTPRYVSELLVLELDAGNMSNEHSSCKYTGCESQDVVCTITCVLRDANGNVCSRNAGDILLEATYSNYLNLIGNLHNTTSFSESHVMSPTDPGTFTYSFMPSFASHAVYKVFNVNTDQYVNFELVADFPTQDPDVSKSFLNTTIPAVILPETSLNLEVVLVDSFSNILCYGEYSNVLDAHEYHMLKMDMHHNSLDDIPLVQLAVRTGSTATSIEAEAQYYDFEMSHECSSDSKSLNTASLSFISSYHGTAMLDVVVTFKGTSSSLLSSPIITMFQPSSCSQEGKYKCNIMPSDADVLARNYKYSCESSEAVCTSKYRCADHQSACWCMPDDDVNLMHCKPTNGTLNPMVEDFCQCKATRCTFSRMCFKTADRCPHPNICAADEVLCPDMSCSPKDYSRCPLITSCPTSVLICGDLFTCSVSHTDCMTLPATKCPKHASLLCWDRTTCVSQMSSCPSVPICPSGYMRCQNGMCVQSAKECQAPNTCTPDRPFQCADGTCSTADGSLCSSKPSCEHGLVLTSDNRCAVIRTVDDLESGKFGACPEQWYQCADGSCVSAFADCPAALHCIPPLILCPDGSCQAHPSMCPYQSTHCPVPYYNCMGGMCVMSPEYCPSGITCPESHPFLCPSGICRESIKECSVNENHSDVYYLPNGSELFTSGVYDTSTLAQASLTREAFSPVSEDAFPANSTFIPISSLVQSDQCPKSRPVHCSTTSRCAEKYNLCPVRALCPSSLPHRCFDGRCVRNELNCPNVAVSRYRGHCPIGYVLCKGSFSCAESYSMCPHQKICSTDELKCGDGSCRPLIEYEELPEGLLESVNLMDKFFVGERMTYEVGTTRLKRAFDDCVHTHTHKGDFKLSCCVGNECSGSKYEDCIATKKRHINVECNLSTRAFPCSSDGPAISTPCPPDYKYCYDGSCIPEFETCSDITICPYEKPYRCNNNQCVAAMSLCEKDISCPDGSILCDDGSCASSRDECSSIRCPSDRPSLCWDQTCRKTPGDCPPTQTCDNGYHFCSSLGKCLRHHSLCSASLSYINIDVDSNDVGCPPKKYRCPDSSCRMSSQDCPASTCQGSLPYKCPDGKCVAAQADCVQSASNSCLETELSYKCSATVTVCNNPYQYGTLPKACRELCSEGKHYCADGTCIDSTTVCERNSNGCPLYSPYRCSNGQCVSNLDQCMSTLRCIPPFHLCDNGICAISLQKCEKQRGFVELNTTSAMKVSATKKHFISDSRYESFVNRFFNKIDLFDTIQGMSLDSSTISVSKYCNSSSAPFLCSDGSCVSHSRLCRMISPCDNMSVGTGDDRCVDGTCKQAAKLCRPTSSICPSHLPVMCQTGPYSGTCVLAQTQCYSETGCPSSIPFMCDDGTCQLNQSLCANFLSKNGCPLDKPVRCNSGKCTAKEIECSFFNGCPALLPVKCSDGECVAEGKDCKRIDSYCPGDTPHICENGECVLSPAHCKQLNECPVSQPIRCADGSCGSAPGQYDSMLFALQESDIRHTNVSSLVVEGTTCRPVPICPADRPFICADFSCVSRRKFCPPCPTCRVSNLDVAFCPPTQPVLCHDGSCVSTPGNCPNTVQCPLNKPYKCFTGACVTHPVFCAFNVFSDLSQVILDFSSTSTSSKVSAAVSSSTTSTTTQTKISVDTQKDASQLSFSMSDLFSGDAISYNKNAVSSGPDFTMCPDGSFKKSSECGFVPPCNPLFPKRCSDGTCVKEQGVCSGFEYSASFVDEATATKVSLMDYLLPYKVKETGEMACSFGELCEDGICRMKCPLTLSCRLGYMMCPDGSCVPIVKYPEDDFIRYDADLCKGLFNCDVDHFRCYDGRCVSSMKDCDNYHYYLYVPDEVSIIVSPGSMADVDLYTREKSMFGTINFPTAVLVKPTQPFLLQVDPIELNVLNDAYMIISDANRAKQLRLNQMVRTPGLLVSCAVSISAATFDDTAVTSLNVPIALSLIMGHMTYLEKYSYVSSIYINPLDLADDEYCYALLSDNQWTCISESQVFKKDGRLWVNIQKLPVKIAYIAQPKSEKYIKPTVEQNSANVTVIILTVFLVILLFMSFCVCCVMCAMKKQWEKNEKLFEGIKTGTTTEDLVTDESLQSSAWKPYKGGAPTNTSQKMVNVNSSIAEEVMLEGEREKQDEIHDQQILENEDRIQALIATKEELLQQISNLKGEIHVTMSDASSFVGSKTLTDN